MNTYKLIYNPYTVETRLYVRTQQGFEAVSEESALSMITKERMQKWLQPHDSWPGFFAALKEAAGDDKVKIIFVGTAEDYKDFTDARNRAARQFHIQADLEYGLDKVSQLHASGDYKLAQIKAYIDDIKNRKDIGFLPPDIVEYMEHSLDSYFEINVTAPVSAGKSTVQNALIGRRLLPTSNEAKTAVITRTEIDNGMSEFTASSILHNGKKETYSERVTQAMISRLNDEIDPGDPEGKNALRDMIMLKGPSPQFDGCALRLVFVDTPGGNNAMNQRHKAVMRKALDNENKNMILFVFSHTTISHENTIEALTEAAEAMKRGLNGQMSQDRFLFVCTCCDQVTDNLPKTESVIRQVLNSCGIESPNLFMISALFVELLRTEEYNRRMEEEGTPELRDKLSRKSKEDLRHCINQLSDPDCDLYRYSSVSEEKKQQYGEQIALLREIVDECESKLEESDYGTELTDEEEKDLERKIMEAQTEIALINSGIPALELVIREYLNRYAIPMKIQQVCLNVKRKADEVDMKQKATSRWSSSLEAAAAAKKAAEDQKKKFEQSQELKKDREALKNLKLNKGGILSRKAKCLQKIQNMAMPRAESGSVFKINGKEGTWIKKSAADTYLSFLNASIEDKMGDMSESMTDYYNGEIIEACTAILNNYKHHIDMIREKGLFNLDGIDIEKMTDSFEFSGAEVDLDEISEVRREAIGSHQVAKKGIWNGIKRFFGSSSGYESVTDYGDIEYVFVQDIFENQRAMAVNYFEEWVEEQTGMVEARIEGLKKRMENKMALLDQYIKDLYDEYIKKLDNVSALEREAAELKQQSDWLDSFLGHIDGLLEIHYE